MISCLKKGEPKKISSSIYLDAIFCVVDFSMPPPDEMMVVVVGGCVVKSLRASSREGSSIPLCVCVCVCVLATVCVSLSLAQIGHRQNLILFFIL